MGSAETVARNGILLVIGGMAGAAAFTHVHDLTVAHGQPHWIGWANAVAVELMAIYLGLDIRARRRVGRPVGLVATLLAGFALLSVAAQVAEAEPSVWGWIVAAVPSLAFLALVKVVLSSTPTVHADEPPAGVVRPESVPEPVIYRPAPRPTGGAVLPPLGVVRPARTTGGGDPMTDRTYPLPRPDHDPRFTYGLMFDVRQVLIDHGYPASHSGRDLVELQLALFGFLYGPAVTE